MYRVPKLVKVCYLEDYLDVATAESYSFIYVSAGGRGCLNYKLVVIAPLVVR